VKDGVSYVAQLVPDIAPQRIKFGWPGNLLKRPANHRCTAPTAQLIRSWPCAIEQEPGAIAHITQVDCHPLGSREVFDVDDLDAVLNRAAEFFAASPMPASSTAQRCARRLNAAKLRLERLKHCVTQQQLADRVGVDLNTVQRWEAGERSPPRFLQKLCEALGVTPPELVETDEWPARRTGK